jgi:hypothetical protein
MIRQDRFPHLKRELCSLSVSLRSDLFERGAENVGGLGRVIFIQLRSLVNNPIGSFL